MAAIPLWALGRHVTAVTIQPFAAAPDGTLTSGASAQALTAIIDEIELDHDSGPQNVPPLTSNHESMVPVRQNNTYTLSEILRPAAGLNILALVYYDFATIGSESIRCDYARIQITRAGKVFTDYFLMAEYTESIRQGKNVGRMVLMQAEASGDAAIGYANA